MYLTALIIDCIIARLYRHNGALNKSVKPRPGTTEWNQTCYRDYTWSMLNCNGEFLENVCSSAEIATCLGALSYCRLKRAPLKKLFPILSYPWRTGSVKIGISVGKFYNILYSLFVRSR